MLITAGQRDPICPAIQTEALADYSERQGAEVSLHWQPGEHDTAPDEPTAVQRFVEKPAP